MKFLKSCNVTYTDKLFLGKYRYKAVISSGLSGWFRGGNLDKIALLLKHGDYYSRNASNAEKTYASKLSNFLHNIDVWSVRVESPYITLYVNDIKNLESLVKLSGNRVKYISIPDPQSESKLIQGTVLVKNLDFNYKVTLGATNQNHGNFIVWCQGNSKVRLPKRAAKDLSKEYSPGGGYFYVKDDKNLTMVRMFLGRTITKVENVIRA